MSRQCGQANPRKRGTTLQTSSLYDRPFRRFERGAAGSLGVGAAAGASEEAADLSWRREWMATQTIVPKKPTVRTRTNIVLPSKDTETSFVEAARSPRNLQELQGVMETRPAGGPREESAWASAPSSFRAVST